MIQRRDVEYDQLLDIRLHEVIRKTFNTDQVILLTLAERLQKELTARGQHSELCCIDSLEVLLRVVVAVLRGNDIGGYIDGKLLQAIRQLEDSSPAFVPVVRRSGVRPSSL